MHNKYNSRYYEEKLQRAGELGTVLNLAKKASAAIMPLYGNVAVEIKGDDTPVTLADKKANEIILNGLQEAFPEDGIVSEEMATVTGDRVWYVDPIDGTRGFIGQTGEFAIHIGLAEEGKPVLGVVYRPVNDEYFYGVKGHGAFHIMGDVTKRLVVDQDPPYSRTAVVRVGSEKIPGLDDLVAKLQPTAEIYSGSEGLRLMYLAQNKADFHLTGTTDRLGNWDVCAPHAILEEAGGFVRRPDGSEVLYTGERMFGSDVFATRTQKQMDYMIEKLS